MAELPYMPTIVQRILADTSHLTTEQTGAYALLLWKMWAEGGKLPAIESELIAITRLSRHKFRKNWPTLFRLFIEADGYLSQKRLTETWLNVQALRRKRVEAGREGAAKRWDGKPIGPAIATKTKIKESSESSFLAGREMTAEEFMNLKQRRAPLPVALKGR